MFTVWGNLSDELEQGTGNREQALLLTINSKLLMAKWRRCCKDKAFWKCILEPYDNKLCLCQGDLRCDKNSKDYIAL